MKNGRALQRQKILQVDLQRNSLTVLCHSPSASYLAQQEEEEETDGQSESKEIGRGSFKEGHAGRMS